MIKLHLNLYFHSHMTHKTAHLNITSFRRHFNFSHHILTISLLLLERRVQFGHYLACLIDRPCQQPHRGHRSSEIEGGPPASDAGIGRGQSRHHERAHEAANRGDGVGCQQ